MKVTTQNKVAKIRFDLHTGFNNIEPQTISQFLNRSRLKGDEVLNYELLH